MKKRKVVRKKEKEISEELVFIAKVNSLNLVSICCDGDSSDLMQILPSVGLRKKSNEIIISPAERMLMLALNESMIDEMYALALKKDGRISYYKFRKLWKQYFKQKRTSTD